MPERQEDTNIVIFKKIDEHDGRLKSLEIFKEVANQRLANSDRRHDEIHGQLLGTESKIMEKLVTQEKLLGELNSDRLMAQGAKNQWRLIGGLIAIAYTAAQMAILLKTFAG